MGLSKLLVAASLLAALPAVAGIESIEVKGEGKTRNAAINDALVSAMQQVVGVNVSSENLSVDQFQQSNEGFEFNKQNASAVSFGTAGSATYRILSEDCSGDKCAVRLLANVEYDDDAARQKKLKGINKNRRTMAVERFSGPKAETLTNAVETLFVQDRKFRVIDDASKPGVDYQLRANIVEAATKTTKIDNSRTVALTGETISDVQIRHRSKVVVEYEIIDLINNQVKWRNKVTTTSSRNNLSLLLDISANKIFDQLKSNIYPLLLIAAEDGSLMLNSGGSSVKQGQRFAIFAVGEQIIDPITNESLGYSETKVAEVKVTKVLPKLAYVTVVSGDRDQLLDYPIARPIAPEPKPKAPKPSKPNKTTTPEEQPPKAGGIVL